MMLGLQRLQCRRVRHALWDYIAERLSEGPLEDVERHLNVCSACRHEAESMRQAQRLLSVCRHEAIPAPRSDWSALRARLQTECQPATHVSREQHPARHFHTPHLVRSVARQRNRWAYTIVSSGALAAVLLLTAFGYRNLHMANMLNRQHSPSEFEVTAPKSSADQTPAEIASVQGSSTDSADQNIGNILIPLTDFMPDNEDGSGPTRHDSVQPTAATHSSVSGPAKLSLAANPSERRLGSADNVRRLTHKMRDEAQNHGNTPHFRPYKVKPEDALPQTDPGEDHYAMSSVVPIPSGNGGAYVTPSLHPVPYDDETSY